ncbi:hypothetical protein SKAU_G00382400 [Synaphobranchus kaupii]|uniref:Uncharacterized protein n=1 Tax=Synaphobranchus kaupii TaxID=118154 RepID=A0A9Q1IDY9_SYNKA|nr:hypothetical protein SKAU_G00382400 [Synaphobranchus kaupii]
MSPGKERSAHQRPPSSPSTVESLRAEKDADCTFVSGPDVFSQACIFNLLCFYARLGGRCSWKAVPVFQGAGSPEDSQDEREERETNGPTERLRRLKGRNRPGENHPESTQAWHEVAAASLK